MQDVAASRLHLTPYDLLGYLTPGGTMMVSIFAFEYLVNRAITPARGEFVVKAPLLESATQLFALTMRSRSSAGVVAVAAALVALAYVVGHVIASVSALLIDRTLVYKGYGYPSSNLLGLEVANDDDRDFSRAYYRGAFFWINVGLVALYTALFMTRRGSAFLLVAALVIGVYVLVATALKLLLSSHSRSNC